MEKTQKNFAVLFADVAGSTHIYEKFGDTKASAIINTTLNIMTEIVEQHGGILIKTIGDEVMCRFDHVDNAVESACEFNEQLDINPPFQKIILVVRTGIHWGPALLQEDGDLFGDVVNVAARMTGIAQARQIITTEDTVSHLNEHLKLKCREFDRAEVKGKAESLVIYEVVWEPQYVTRLVPILNITPKASAVKPLLVTYQDFKKTISSETGPVLMGRSEQCDIVVQSPVASRNHAAIKFNRGKFILVDQSTNGTYVCLSDGKKFYLRRENLPLSGSGIISLGEEFGADETHYIHFKFDVGYAF